MNLIDDPSFSDGQMHARYAHHIVKMTALLPTMRTLVRDTSYPLYVNSEHVLTISARQRFSTLAFEMERPLVGIDSRSSIHNIIIVLIRRQRHCLAMGPMKPASDIPSGFMQGACIITSRPVNEGDFIPSVFL